jgi:benzoyl-CoA reductase/2-hydroxyglutaryl-CoA dehydratase subunit BcrC/BadD/HgdB
MSTTDNATSNNNHNRSERVGFACSYTPLPLIHAAGFVPFRLLPLGDAPDQAGTLLHDNLCPYVKRILDRGLAGQLPPLSGLVLVNSCDAMRRLADAWREALPDDRLVFIDLPVTSDEAAMAYFARQLARLRDELASWTGRTVSDEQIFESVRLYNDLSVHLDRLRRENSGRAHQLLLNRSVTEPPEAILAELRSTSSSSALSSSGVPLFIFGNVLPDPEAFQLFEESGGRVVSDDLCTGSRQITALEVDPARGDPLAQLARGLLERPICARTLFPAEPHRLAEQVIDGARRSGARGVVAHVMKFCDPYLARIPAVRDRLREAGLPLLVLEGDCTQRSLGQHRTRIEAFVEMLQEG